MTFPEKLLATGMLITVAGGLSALLTADQGQRALRWSFVVTVAGGAVVLISALWLIWS